MHASPFARIVATAACALAVTGTAPAQLPATGATAPASPETAPAAANPLADFYLAKTSAQGIQRQFELRLRDDGRAWLVIAASARAAAASPAPAPSAPAVPEPTFETGTWHATRDARGVSVVLDTTAPIRLGAPASPGPENELLTFAFRACTLALVSASPTPLADGLQFAKRHCP